jgi:hypothetical protein
MLARRTISPTFLGTALVAAALLTGTVSAESAADAAEDARAEHFVRRRIPGLTPQERDERATRAGALHIRGRTRLAGTVFATHVHVERGAEVLTDGDLVIYSTGGIVIDAPIGGSATVERRKAMKVPPPGTGANGADGADITMIDTAGDIAINADVSGNAGTAGESVNVAGPFGRGGHGGRGGDVTIWAKKKGATVTVSATIACARGGGGGKAVVTGANGDAGQTGQSAEAIGGDAGAGGAVNISATNVVFLAPQGVVAWPSSATGGDAGATGGKGGDVAVCFAPRAGAGGSARATGGDGGRGSDVRITATTIAPDPSVPGGASAFVNTGQTGAGGYAEAFAGAGGVGPDTCPSSCSSAGRTGSDGAPSGSALGRGGNGANSSRVIINGLSPKTHVVAEQEGGDGGLGAAYPASGRAGAVGEEAARPGLGGRGGDVGRVSAFGGKGGACRVGLRVTGDASFGGDGGAARIGDDGAPAVKSGDGGFGGRCCANQGGYYLGGTGGTAGKVGPEVATPGKGGKAKSAKLGAPGLDGAVAVRHSDAGARGLVGADCPAVVGDVTMSDATLTDPLHVNVNAPLRLEFTNRGAQVTLALEVCCDGRPIGHFQFVVGGGSPGLPFIAVFLANLYISEKHAGHHISVMINGKTVKEFIRAVL